VPRIYTKKSEQEKRRRLRNTMTEAEKILWLQLKNKRLGVRFLRQFSIGAFVVDFYCPALKLAIEVDGATHNTPDEIEYDKNRENEIDNLNIKFLRFLNEEVYNNLNAVTDKIRAEINSFVENENRKSRF
jgi:very-short-patch-repair endonuclease